MKNIFYVLISMIFILAGCDLFNSSGGRKYYDNQGGGNQATNLCLNVQCPVGETCVDGDCVSSSQVVPAPVITPNGGSFNNSVPVYMSAISGATIYYTMDLTEPTCNGVGTEYSVPKTLIATKTIKAIACVDGMIDSTITEKLFTIGSSSVAAPTFTPTPSSGNPPTYSSTSNYTVNIQAAQGATIYYTLWYTYISGLSACSVGPYINQYTQGIQITQGHPPIHAIACMNGQASAVASAQFLVQGGSGSSCSVDNDCISTHFCFTNQISIYAIDSYGQPYLASPTNQCAGKWTTAGADCNNEITCDSVCYYGWTTLWNGYTGHFCEGQ